MELFVINRYTGDEPEDGKTPNEDELKKKLLKKIKQRKRQSQISESETENNLKAKKRKEENIDGDDPTENEIPQDENKVEKKKKKKKKADGVNQNESHDYGDESFQDTIDENDKSPKAKKSKKSKKSKVINKEKEEKTENQEEREQEEGSLNESSKEHTGFTILGNLSMSKKQKVKRKLPDWLANPSVVSVDFKNLSSTIDSIPLLDKIFVDVLRENNITHFFPVQSQIIPWLLQNANRPHMYWPNDVCVSAPTGSGKTLAFVLPILQVLHKRIVPRIRALVVLPVQDLANQVFRVFETYSKPTKLKILLLSGKRPFTEEQSLICKNDGIGNYITLVDIIVTTPGRLVDHLTKTKGFCLDNLMYLVIDEADRVMENVQNDWLYHLSKCLNSDCTRSYQVPIISYINMLTKRRPPNKLLFSATLSQDPEKLQQLGLFQPKLFTSVVSEREQDVKDECKFIGKFTTPAELTEYYVNCSKASKPLIVYHLIEAKSWRNILCFVNSSEATYRLAYVLKALSNKKLKIANLSAILTIKKRDEILKKFSKGKIDVLVSSDTLARGIDIPNVQYVISYDAPKFVKTYVHRIGRTARAGKEGSSLVLLTSKEVKSFNKMIEDAGKSSVEELKIDENELESYQKPYEEALNALGNQLQNQKRKLIKTFKAKKKLQLLAERGNFIKTGKKSVKKKFKVQKSKA